VGAAGCLALGWWQLERYDSAAGTAQNLGYALQWPLFAAFLVYAYRRFVRLEQESNAEGAPRAADPKEIAPELLPPRPTVAPDEPRDPELDAYNAYLAELARNDAAAPHPTERSTT
jgi:DNA-binding transcriptional regulator of glucitol operon